MNETFTVRFHVDSQYSSFIEDCEYKIHASRHDPGAVEVIVPDVDEVLIESMSDDDLAEFFGLPSEGLVYTERPD